MPALVESRKKEAGSQISSGLPKISLNAGRPCKLSFLYACDPVRMNSVVRRHIFLEIVLGVGVMFFLSFKIILLQSHCNIY